MNEFFQQEAMHSLKRSEDLRHSMLVIELHKPYSVLSVNPVSPVATFIRENPELYAAIIPGQWQHYCLFDNKYGCPMYIGNSLYRVLEAWYADKDNIAIIGTALTIQRTVAEVLICGRNVPKDDIGTLLENLTSVGGSKDYERHYGKPRL